MYMYTPSVYKYMVYAFNFSIFYTADDYETPISLTASPGS